MSASEDHADDFQRLHGLVADMADVKGYLDGMTGVAAAMMTRLTGDRIECAVTLRRRKRSATIAGSSDEAILLDGVEQRQGAGPCALALKIQTPVLLADVSSDQRWPRYSETLAAAGYRSALGVPLKLSFDSDAVLNFFAPVTGVFTTDVIKDAQVFAGSAAQALGLVLRIETAEQVAGDLMATLASRTVIDVACGVIMAQNRCGRDEAFTILREVSSHRNQKLRAVAEQVVANVSGTKEIPTRFEE